VNPVNLLPAKHRPRTPTGGLAGSSYVVVGVLGVTLVMVLFYVLTVNGINSRKNQVVKAKAETAQAQARAASLSAYGDFSKIKEQRVQSVKQLADGRIDWERLARGLARVLPSGVWLTSASASATGTPTAAGGASSSSPGAAPGGTDSSTATSPKVELIGCAPSHSAVAVTLVRLRELPGAQDVQLNDITRPQASAGTTSSGTGATSAGAAGDSDCGTIHGAQGAKWDATVIFSSNPGSGTKEVPKSLGGGA
jgi:Tfp pilus assembly protein PilN